MFRIIYALSIVYVVQYITVLSAFAVIFHTLYIRMCSISILYICEPNEYIQAPQRLRNIIAYIQRGIVRSFDVTNNIS